LLCCAVCCDAMRAMAVRRWSRRVSLVPRGAEGLDRAPARRRSPAHSPRRDVHPRRAGHATTPRRHGEACPHRLPTGAAALLGAASWICMYVTGGARWGNVTLWAPDSVGCVGGKRKQERRAAYGRCSPPLACGTSASKEVFGEDVSTYVTSGQGRLGHRWGGGE